jgi:HTH-type transcriptional regulator / antitoxin HigA
MNDKSPAPGDQLKDLLQKHKWEQKDLAEAMGRPLQLVNELISGKRRITIETAIELEAVFSEFDGPKAQDWLNLDTAIQLRKVRSDSTAKVNLIQRKTKLRTEYPALKEALKRKWVQDSVDVEILENNVRTFFTRTEEFPFNFKASNTAGAIQENVKAWLCRVIDIASQQQVNSFSIKSISKCKDDLLKKSLTPNDISEVPKILNQYGIKFVYLEHITKCPVDGVAFRGKDKNPVIGISLRYGQFDRFWFVLLHELAHITLSHIDSSLDVDIYEKMQAREVSTIEAEANEWASDALIPKAKYVEFTENNFFFDYPVIKEFSETIKRHESIVIGRLKHDSKLTYNQLASVHENIREYLKEFKSS